MEQGSAEMDISLLLPFSVLILVWILFGVLFALLWPRIRQRVGSLRPRTRSLFTFMYVILPPGIAAAVAVLVFTPLIGGINLSGHCHAMDCTAHVPVLFAGPISTVVLSVGLLLGTLTLLFLPAVALWSNWRITVMLTRLADKQVVPDFYLLDTSEAVACCTGLLSPTVIISRGLQQRLTPEQLKIIVSHELAHACRYDNLCRLLASWATVIWPAARRQQVLGDLELACEQACDEYVVESVRNRALVAEVIKTVATWQSGKDSALTDKHSLWQDRVSALMQLSEDDSMRGWKTAMSVVTGSAVLMLVASDGLHRATEALAFIVRVY